MRKERQSVRLPPASHFSFRALGWATKEPIAYIHDDPRGDQVRKKRTGTEAATGVKIEQTQSAGRIFSVAQAPCRFF
jgi:hypothetical protein